MKVSSLLSTFLEITFRKRDHFYIGFCVFDPAGVLLVSNGMEMGCSFPFFAILQTEHAFKAKKVAFRGIRGMDFEETWKSTPKIYKSNRLPRRNGLGER